MIPSKNVYNNYQNKPTFQEREKKHYYILHNYFLDTLIKKIWDIKIFILFKQKYFSHFYEYIIAIKEISKMIFHYK